MFSKLETISTFNAYLDRSIAPLIQVDGLICNTYQTQEVNRPEVVTVRKVYSRGRHARCRITCEIKLQQYYVTCVDCRETKNDDLTEFTCPVGAREGLKDLLKKVTNYMERKIKPD